MIGAVDESAPTGVAVEFSENTISIWGVIRRIDPADLAFAQAVARQQVSPASNLDGTELPEISKNCPRIVRVLLGFPDSRGQYQRQGSILVCIGRESFIQYAPVSARILSPLPRP